MQISVSKTGKCVSLKDSSHYKVIFDSIHTVLICIPKYLYTDGIHYCVEEVIFTLNLSTYLYHIKMLNRCSLVLSP